MALTEADFALFETEPVPYAEPAQQKRGPIKTVKPLKDESVQDKKDKGRRVFIQSLIAYAVTGVVALCLFLVIQSGAQYHVALLEQQQLRQELELAQQDNINYKAQLERKYSLEVIQNTALQQFHMVPIEGGRVTYLNITHGDQRLS